MSGFGTNAWIALICCWGLVGCSLGPAFTDISAPAARVLTVPSTQFVASGRFSARGDGQQGSGQFRFEQNGEHRKLEIFSPVGAVVAEINADRYSATLIESNGTTRTATSLVDLLRQVMDLPLSDAQLSAWLQGLPQRSGNVAMTWDKYGLPASFTESGWEITISDRMQLSSDKWLPRRMRWVMQAQVDTEVRWVMDAWSVL